MPLNPGEKNRDARGCKDTSGCDSLQQLNQTSDKLRGKDGRLQDASARDARMTDEILYLDINAEGLRWQNEEAAAVFQVYELLTRLPDMRSLTTNHCVFDWLSFSNAWHLTSRLGPMSIFQHSESLCLSPSDWKGRSMRWCSWSLKWTTWSTWCPRRPCTGMWSTSSARKHLPAKRRRSPTSTSATPTSRELYRWLR